MPHKHSTEKMLKRNLKKAQKYLCKLQQKLAKSHEANKPVVGNPASGSCQVRGRGFKSQQVRGKLKSILQKKTKRKTVEFCGEVEYYFPDGRREKGPTVDVSQQPPPLTEAYRY